MTKPETRCAGSTRNHRYLRLVRTVVSSRLAFLIVAVSTAIFVVCLWKEWDQLGSYFNQDSYWTPPILVVSSDDWGGVMPPETVEDLDKMQDVLRSVTDAQGKPLVLTAYMNPAEPDFERIAERKYASYSYHYCYRNRPEVASRLCELSDRGIIDIQFHGREHYNIPLWLTLLRGDHPDFRKACLAGYVPWREGPGWDVKTDPRLPFLRQSFVDASSYPPNAIPIDTQYEMIASGLAMMRTELGVEPVIFTPPGYAYDTNTLQAMDRAGLWFLDSVRDPIQVADEQGRRAESGQRWDYAVEVAGIQGIVRNVFFEPYKSPTSPQEVLESAMIRVRRALLSGKPVVISSHRWNYVGAINPNRDRDMLLLHDLIVQTKAEAPSIVFLSASDLARHLYREGACAQRSVSLEHTSLSPIDRIVHGLRCTWLGHSRIRIACLFFAISLLWLCFHGVSRKQSVLS